MSPNYSFTHIVSTRAVHQTHSRIVHALMRDGIPEAREVPLNDLAEQIEVQKLHGLAEDLGIRPLGLYRGKAVNTSRSEGMAVLCVFETEDQAQRFRQALS